MNNFGNHSPSYIRNGSNKSSFKEYSQKNPSNKYFNVFDNPYAQPNTYNAHNDSRIKKFNLKNSNLDRNKQLYNNDINRNNIFFRKDSSSSQKKNRNLSSPNNSKIYKNGEAYSPDYVVNNFININNINIKNYSNVSKKASKSSKINLIESPKADKYSSRSLNNKKKKKNIQNHKNTSSSLISKSNHSINKKKINPINIKEMNEAFERHQQLKQSILDKTLNSKIYNKNNSDYKKPKSNRIASPIHKKTNSSKKKKSKDKIKVSNLYNNRSRTFDNLSGVSNNSIKNSLYLRKSKNYSYKNFNENNIGKRIKKNDSNNKKKHNPTIKSSNISTNSKKKIKDGHLMSNLLSKDPVDFKSSLYLKHKMKRSKSPSIKESSKNKIKNSKSVKPNKNSKLMSLFIEDSIPFVDLKSVIDNWNIIILIYNSLKEESNLENALNSYFLHFFKKQYNCYSGMFSKFNSIGNKIQEMIILEFWGFYLLFYSLHEEGNINSEIWKISEKIFEILIKDLFYITLIIIKARKNGGLAIQKGIIDIFNEYMKKYDFPIGVPLIKTLKEGNEKIKILLKEGLYFTSRKIRREFEWSIDNINHDYYQIILKISSNLTSELKHKRKKYFPRLTGTEFIFREEENIFDNDSIYQQLSDSMTCMDFFSDCLDRNINSSLKIEKNQENWNRSKHILKSDKNLKKNQNEKAKSVNLRKETNNNSKKYSNKDFKLNKLLSNISSKYKPLSNVSELRDSAMSQKRSSNLTNKSKSSKRTTDKIKRVERSSPKSNSFKITKYK